MTTFYLLITVSALAGTVQGQSIITAPDDRAEVVGTAAMFYCEIHLDDNPFMAWEFNNKIIYSFQSGSEEYKINHGKYMVAQDGEHFTLTVKNLEHSDQGIYKCKTMDISASAKLIVLAPDNSERESIITPPDDATELIGKTAEFQCEMDLENNPFMAWEFNSKIIYSFQSGVERYKINHGKYHVTQDGRHFILTVNNLKHRDGGIYQCVATNSHASATLIVLDSPQLYTMPTNNTRKRVFYCMARFGGPSKDLITPAQYPELQMYLDGTPLDGKVQEQETSDHEEYHRLLKVYHTVLEPDMKGMTVMCAIGTSTPNKSVVANIEVAVQVATSHAIDQMGSGDSKEKEDIDSYAIAALHETGQKGSKENEVKEDIDDKLAKGQVIITPPDDTTEIIGGTAKFRCELGSEPVVVMIWEYNDQVIYSFTAAGEYIDGLNKYSVKQDRKTFTLTVYNLLYGDGGVYRCGTVKQNAAANLVILDKPVLFHIEWSPLIYSCIAKVGGPSKDKISHDHFPKLQMFMNETLLEGKFRERDPEEDTDFYIIRQKQQCMQQHQQQLTDYRRGQQTRCGGQLQSQQKDHVDDDWGCDTISDAALHEAERSLVNRYKIHLQYHERRTREIIRLLEDFGEAPPQKRRKVETNTGNSESAGVTQRGSKRKACEENEVAEVETCAKKAALRGEKKKKNNKLTIRVWLDNMFLQKAAVVYAITEKSL